MEDVAVEDQPDAVLQLAARLGCSWPHIATAGQAAEAERRRLGHAIAARRLIPEDTSFVVFGSLARGEWTPGSDVDWALLVDGPADDNHLTMTHAIRREIDAGGWRQPGREQLFGGLAISHELVHRIGGDNDSNRNITQRILLLLESRSPVPEDTVRERVLRVVLKRYMDDDFGYAMRPSAAARVPRFLLNDIVRYWRTMTVDFAAKRKARAGEGWLVRNFKLRLSRKLIFAAGLSASFSCALRPPAALARVENETEGDFAALMTEHVLSFADRTPLSSLAWLALEFDAKPEVARGIFDAYDAFLAILQDGERRKRLEGLTPDTMKADPLFRETREIGDRFQDGLTSLFFGTDDALTTAIQRYGVF
jgi:hypothetical protein